MFYVLKSVALNFGRYFCVFDLEAPNGKAAGSRVRFSMHMHIEFRIGFDDVCYRNNGDDRHL